MFFARLANIPDLGSLSAKRCVSLYQEYLHWRGRPWIPDDPDKQRWEDVQMLISLHGQVRTYVLPLLRGKQVGFSVAYDTTAQLQGRTLVEHPRDQPHRFGRVEAVCWERPFPFQLCARCGKVFVVQQSKGRPQRFCSATCQMKRAPGQRAKEMREYRRKKREHDLKIVKNILRDHPRAQWMQQLQAEFTQKKHGYKNQRQLERLIGQARTER